MKSFPARLLDNLKAGMVQQCITVAFPILSLPVFVKTWGLNLYGEWLLVSALPTYIMLAPDLGAAGAALNRIAFASGRRDWAQANLTFQSSYLLLLVATVAFCLLGMAAVASVPVKELLNLKLLEKTDISLILASLLMSISVQQMHYITSAHYRAASRNARFALWLSVRSLAQIGLLGLVLFFSMSPLAYAVSGLGIFIIFLVITSIDGARLESGLSFGFSKASTTEMKSLIKPGLGFAAYPILHSLQNQGNLLLVGGVLGPAAAASFNAMRTLANTSRSLFGLLVASVNVEAAMAIGESKTIELKQILGKMYIISFAMFLVGTVVTFTVAEPIYRMWVGREAHWSAPLVLSLLFSILGLSLASAPEIIISAKNQLHRLAISLLFLLSIYLAFTYWLLSTFSFTGLIISQGLWGMVFLGFFLLPSNRNLAKI